MKDFNNIEFKITNCDFDKEAFLDKLYNINQRDITTIEIECNEVRFNTKIGFKSINGFKYVNKKEVFQFDERQDAELFFYRITNNIHNETK